MHSAPAVHKEYVLRDLRGYNGNSVRHGTCYQESCNLFGEKRCQHVKLDFNTNINKKR